ncbi:hypothetical protein HI914_07504 [Erysiphe necator]|nr:hypothetical protein HI914_07504 [Erysiphe necator]
MPLNPAKHNKVQKYPETHRSYNDIANLTRAYNDEMKYSGETLDNFDDKFNIFMDYYAFPCMLKGIALTFYYNKCRGPEYQRYNQKRCNELTFQDIIDSNPDKNSMEKITILIITLDKIQKTLSNEWQSEVVMHNKIISARKDIEACKMAC